MRGEEDGDRCKDRETKSLARLAGLGPPCLNFGFVALGMGAAVAAAAIPQTLHRHPRRFLPLRCCLLHIYLIGSEPSPHETGKLGSHPGLVPQPHKYIKLLLSAVNASGEASPRVSKFLTKQMDGSEPSAHATGELGSHPELVARLLK